MQLELIFTVILNNITHGGADAHMHAQEPLSLGSCWSQKAPTGHGSDWMPPKYLPACLPVCLLVCLPACLIAYAYASMLPSCYSYRALQSIMYWTDTKTHNITHSSSSLYVVLSCHVFVFVWQVCLHLNKMSNCMSVGHRTRTHRTVLAGWHYQPKTAF